MARTFLDMLFNGCSYALQDAISIGTLVKYLSRVRGQKDDPGTYYYYRSNEEHTFRRNVLLSEAAALESIANLLIELTVSCNSKPLQLAPKVRSRLSQAQLDYLSETRTESDSRGKLRTRKVFISFTDRLDAAVNFAAKVFHEDVHLDKSTEYWEAILRLKEIRDQLTHPKFDHDRLGAVDYTGMAEQKTLVQLMGSILYQPPSVPISDEILIDGIRAVRWYVRVFHSVLSQILEVDLRPTADVILLVDMHLHMALEGLLRSDTQAISRLKREFPEIGMFRYANDNPGQDKSNPSTS